MTSNDIQHKSSLLNVDLLNLLVDWSVGHSWSLNLSMVTAVGSTPLSRQHLPKAPVAKFQSEADLFLWPKFVICRSGRFWKIFLKTRISMKFEQMLDEHWEMLWTSPSRRRAKHWSSGGSVRRKGGKRWCLLMMFIHMMMTVYWMWHLFPPTFVGCKSDCLLHPGHGLARIQSHYL